MTKEDNSPPWYYWSSPVPDGCGLPDTRMRWNVVDYYCGRARVLFLRLITGRPIPHYFVVCIEGEDQQQLAKWYVVEESR